MVCSTDSFKLILSYSNTFKKSSVIPVTVFHNGIKDEEMTKSFVTVYEEVKWKK